MVMTCAPCSDPALARHLAYCWIRTRLRWTSDNLDLSKQVPLSPEIDQKLEPMFPGSRRRR